MTHAAIVCAGRPLDRFSFPVRTHAACGELHADRLQRTAGAGGGAGAGRGADRDVARGAGPALSHPMSWRARCWARIDRRRHDGADRGLILHPLIVSDVYFPRVNGVSTSIRSFRHDLATLGSHPRWWRRILARPTLLREHDVLRVPARPVPFDPEDGIMGWGALRRWLAAVPAEHCELVHVQTPFLAHYAGLQLARAARRAGGRHLPHLFRGLPAPLHAAAAGALPAPGWRAP